MAAFSLNETRARQSASGKTVTLLTTAFGFGGVGSQLIYLSRGLKQRGWDVDVVSLTPPIGRTEVLAAAGVDIHDLAMRPGRWNPSALVALANHLRRRRCQVLHAHGVHANLMGRMSRLLYPVPVLISTAHNIDEGGRAREIGYRLTDRLTDLTTQVSRAGLERYTAIGAVPQGRGRVMVNGVDVERFRPDPANRVRVRRALDVKDRFVWLAIGRIEAAKDYLNLVEAVRLLKRNEQDFAVFIVGQGSQQAELENAIADARLDDTIKLLGVRGDIPDLMNAADAYVMSSRWEGLPVALLEASAAGLPIVATDVGGNAEIVRDGETGMVVPPADPPALAGAMHRMMALPEAERAALGQAARRRMESHYDIRRVIARWEALYLELLERKGAAIPRPPSGRTGA